MNGSLSAKRRSKETQKETQEVLRMIHDELEDHKACDIREINLAGKTDFADYMVIASGSSQRHVATLAKAIEARLKKPGQLRKATEGHPYCDWVVVDAGSVVIHLFRPEVRSFYNLERMWDVPAGEELNLS